MTFAWVVSVAHKDDHMLLKWIIWVFCLVCISNNGDIVLNFRKIFNPKIYHNQCYNRSILGKNYNWTHQMFSIKIMLRYYLYQLLPFKNCRHWADFMILEMLWWRFWKRQSGKFCIGCNLIPCFCIRYRNAAITEHGTLSRDAMFCSSRIVHPYRRNQPWFQVYTSVCPRGARRENKTEKKLGDIELPYLVIYALEYLLTQRNFLTPCQKQSDSGELDIDYQVS